MARAHGIFSYFGYDLPLRQRLELIAQAGISHTSLWWGPPEGEFLAGRIAQAPAMARDLGLVVENLHVPFEECNDLWLSPRQREDFRRRHMAWIDDAQRHAVPTIVMHVSHTDAAPPITDAGLATFDDIARHAQQAGVVLAVENTRRDDILNAVLDSTPLPSVAFCYDSSHDWLWGKPQFGTLRRWGSRLVQTHFSDAQGDRDRHLLPGDGDLDWRTLASLFPQRYQGVLMLEVMPPDLAHTPPETFLQQCRQKLQWLDQLLEEKQDA